MKTLIEEMNTDATMDKSFAVGAVHGVCFGVSGAIALVVLGAIIPMAWRWVSAPATLASSPATTTTAAAPMPPRAFEVATVYKNVPFIGLSESAVKHGLYNPSAKKLIESEMVSRSYFEEIRLKGATRYEPKLADPVNLRSVVTLTNGDMKRVVVQLLTDDGSPGPYGLIPLDEYEDDIRSLGK